MAENKRRAGRPPKNATPATKRQKTAVTPKEQTPVVEIVEKEREATPLPNKVAESKPLPTLSRPQPLDLPDDEYQSIGASGVLAASLERSRQKWVSGEFFQKYWTKTSTRKDAPPPPPNNPQRTWMKEVGSCTMTIEPLILEEVHVFHLKEPNMPAPVVQNIPAPRQQQQQQQQHHQVQYQTPNQPPSQQNIHHQPAQPNLQPAAPSPYGTPYRPQQPCQNPPQPNQYYHQNRPLPPQSAPLSMPTPDNRTLPPIMPAAPVPPPLAVAPRPPPPAAPAPPPKPSPDPVIQMLATRASSDHELKALMKVVATGSANQEQLRIFQRHIDELTAIINQNKKTQPPPPPPPPPQQQPTPITPMHGAGAYSNVPSRTSTPGISGPQQILPRPGPVNTPPPLKPPGQQKHPNQYTAQSQKQAKAQHHPVQPPQKYYPPAQQPSLPIVLEFRGEGASPDRFRFPEYSILEFLSPYMLLVSFLYIRKEDSSTSKGGAKEKAQPAGEANKQATEGDNSGQGGEEKPADMSDGKYVYEPITLKITVEETQKGKDLLGFIQRSVKPVVETRAWMTEQIARCMRAQRRYLALRLPHKSQIREGSEEAKEIKESTPVVAERKKVAPRKSMDKKGKEEQGDKLEAGASGQEKSGSATPALVGTPSVVAVPLTAEQEVQAIQDAAAAAADTPVPNGRRSTRKSARISDVQMTDL